jgi:hypothetical protein
VVLRARRLADKPGLRRVKVVMTQSDSVSGQTFVRTVFDSQREIERRIEAVGWKAARAIDFRFKPALDQRRSLDKVSAIAPFRVAILSVILVTGLTGLWLSVRRGGEIVGLLFR